MKKFIVTLKEVYLQGYEIEAEDETSAIEKVMEAEGTVVGDIEYLRMDDDSIYSVQEVK